MERSIWTNVFFTKCRRRVWTGQYYLIATIKNVLYSVARLINTRDYANACVRRRQARHSLSHRFLKRRTLEADWNNRVSQSSTSRRIHAIRRRRTRVQGESVCTNRCWQTAFVCIVIDRALAVLFFSKSLRRVSEFLSFFFLRAMKIF